MEEIAGWVAPAATMIAAMMTAANLGARITGWGFVVFSIGSVAWIVVAVATGQNNLLLANAFLCIVNLVGIWRWLGRRANYDQGAQRAQQASARSAVPTLVQLGGMEGRKVRNRDGEMVGHVVDVMAESESGRISYVVVREGSEISAQDRLHTIAWEKLRVDAEDIVLETATELTDLPEIETDAWPARPLSA